MPGQEAQGPARATLVRPKCSRSRSTKRQRTEKRSSGVGSQLRPSLISRKSHGLMSAPRASITEPTPDRAIRSRASYGVRTSPLPITGTPRSAATRPIRSQSAALL
jgi:hypothetical protein